MLRSVVISLRVSHVLSVPKHLTFVPRSYDLKSCRPLPNSRKIICNQRKVRQSIGKEDRVRRRPERGNPQKDGFDSHPPEEIYCPLCNTSHIPRYYTPSQSLTIYSHSPLPPPPPSLPPHPHPHTKSAHSPWYSPSSPSPTSSTP